MAELRREGEDLVVVLNGIEKAEAAHGDVRVPASSVRGVEVVEDAYDAVSGLKLIGSRWPGRFAIGTFLAGGSTKTFAVVHHDTPRGVRVRLEGAGYDELVVGCADPEGTARQLASTS
ncbi:MAG: hypothetical protein ACRD0B_03405 [Acidimicrobiales bacterium]